MFGSAVGEVTTKRIRIASAVCVGATAGGTLEIQDAKGNHSTQRTIIAGVDSSIWPIPGPIFDGLKIVSLPTGARLELQIDSGLQ